MRQVYIYQNYFSFSPHFLSAHAAKLPTRSRLKIWWWILRSSPRNHHGLTKRAG